MALDGSEPSDERTELDGLQEVFNHLVLPPRLPGSEDCDIEEVQNDILDRFVDITGFVGKRIEGPSPIKDTYASLWRSLQLIKSLYSEGSPSQSVLQQALEKLADGTCLMVYLPAQNSVLLIWGPNSPTNPNNGYRFEAFEASARTEVVTQAPALIWQFPGLAVQVPRDVCESSSFWMNISTFLQQAVSETYPQCSNLTTRADSESIDTRNTSSPVLISEFLMPMLQACGEPSIIPLIQKRVRDDAVFSRGNPWRRSPFYLGLRVFVQRAFVLAHGDIGLLHYKFLMCAMLGGLLRDVSPKIHPEQTILLMNKLGRRLSKLEAIKAKFPSDPGFDKLHAGGSEWLKMEFRNADQRITTKWDSFKQANIRVIPSIPPYADSRALALSLRVSRDYMQSVINLERAGKYQRNTGISGALPQLSAFSRQCFRLVELETSTMRGLASTSSIIRLEKDIIAYLSEDAALYQSDPLHSSQRILLLMESWTKMDQLAVAKFPLLSKYTPPFKSQMLDVLHLAEYSELQRLQTIQVYLKARARSAKLKSIFATPSADSFAVQYFDLEDKLQALMTTVNSADKIEEDRKRKQWTEINKNYERMRKEFVGLSCNFVVNRKYPYDDIHIFGSCHNCLLGKRLKNVTIMIHEKSLPEDMILAKATIFELHPPEEFVAYRSTTAALMMSIFIPSPLAPEKPAQLLTEYVSLQPFFLRRTISSTVDFASMPKSFLKSHYKRVRFPVTFETVIKKNPLKWRYFHSSTGLFLSDIEDSLTLHHLCKTTIPHNSPLSVSQIFMPLNARNPSSSAAAVLSQMSCPANVNVHEYAAIQNLLVGETTRWYSILVELFSTNINIGTEAALVIFNRLILECGPSGSEGNPLRKVHIVFDDWEFCTKLLGYLRQKIEVISENYYENFTMDLLLTLCLRVTSLSQRDDIKLAGRPVIQEAQQACAGWLKKLRVDIRNAPDHNQRDKYTQYALWASILCRRCSFILLQSEKIIPRGHVTDFVISTLMLHQNMIEDPKKRTTTLDNALVRDTQMAYRFRDMILHTFQIWKLHFLLGFNAMWPHTCDVNRKLDLAQLRSSISPEGWVGFPLYGTSEGCYPQEISFNYLSGHMLVNHKPVGSLPSVFASSESLLDILGTTNVFAMDSAEAGMDYQVEKSFNNHGLHLGLRGSQVILRITHDNDVFELIPREHFSNGPLRDLPGILVEDCCHLLNIKTQMLEIRVKPQVWNSQKAEAIINLRTGQCQLKGNQGLLIDTHSPLISNIFQIFQGFEVPANIVVFQPPLKDGKSKFNTLRVELNRFDLLFHVNYSGGLHCHQLHASIDRDQDIGCLYGFQSYIALRADGQPPHQSREVSLIVPLGIIKSRIHGFHVSSYSGPSEEFASFRVNRLLGRLDCAPEPEIVYLKALIHAYTSIPIPDPLTGRTGISEALNILHSGVSSPWNQHISERSVDYLITLANITPIRIFYPPKSELMETVHWHTHLSVSIQSNRFRPAVEAIFREFENLSLFQSGSSGVPALLERIKAELKPSNAHLMARAEQKIEPSSACLFDSSAPVLGLKYRSRDISECLKRTQKVYCTSRISQDCNSPIFTQDVQIVDFLKKFDDISGFTAPSDKVLVGDILSLSPGSEWGPLVALFRSWNTQDRHTIMFQAALLAFREDVPLYYVQALLSFALNADMKLITFPPYTKFEKFSEFQEPDFAYFFELTMKHGIEYEDSDASDLAGYMSSKMASILRARHDLHQSQVVGDCTIIANLLFTHWPSADINSVKFPSSNYIDISSLKRELLVVWQQLIENRALTSHLQRLELSLQQQSCSKSQSPYHSSATKLPRAVRLRIAHGVVVPSVKDLLSSAVFTGTPPLLSFSKPYTSEITNITMSRNSAEMANLKAIINPFMESKSPVRKEYGINLDKSFQALVSIATQRHGPDTTERPTTNSAFHSRMNAFKQYKQIYRCILDLLAPTNAQSEWLERGRVWPCPPTSALLAEIAGVKKNVFNGRVMALLIYLGISITHVQRWGRIHRALDPKHPKPRLVEAEIKNVGHSNWKPQQFPDWLIFEIESDLIIRPSQVDVALATINPKSGSNSVLQMNMGQGKTSVIIPMVACALADGSRLVRIVVPPSLLPQTSQLIQARLGNLIGRHLKHIPFSRATPITKETIVAFSAMHYNSLTNGGIMLCLPDHILSFRLCGLQHMSDNKISVARPMIEFQAWLNKHARDILDECDHTLAVRTQLIYTSGANTALPGHPHRWKIVQEIFRLVLRHLPKLRELYPESIEITPRHTGEFPFIYFLRPDAEDALVDRLARDICLGRTPILPSHLCDQNSYSDIMSFFTRNKVPKSVFKTVDSFLNANPSLRDVFYLLRGLFIHKVLVFCFRKRWNVQYGLHPQRKPMSVPFQAKGVPSEQAEWGHPEVSISFTCLSFYYAGLNRQQLIDCLTHLQSLDDPSTVYKGWAESSPKLSVHHSDWDSVHLEDSDMLTELWRCFKYNLTVIDYFLNNSVFPKHAKQYQFKLAASGWDLIQTEFDDPKQAKPVGLTYAKPLTTGFSGTNDNRDILPLTISQADLPPLLHTNAEVLTYLLDPRNEQVYELESSSTELDLLDFLSKKGIKVLIDVGARILELDNPTLARRWLDADLDARAAVYFDKDRPYVLGRGRKDGIPLLSSRYVGLLDDCLVYLDQAHTRGTDLNLPPRALGALTLGLDLTKDQTTQAAMRLRQLGSTQQVCFVSPQEVTHRIRDMNNHRSGPIRSRHVVSWLLEQTCDGLESLQSLFYFQGMEYCSRVQAKLNNRSFLDNKDEHQRYRKALLQEEPATLRELYDPRQMVQRPPLTNPDIIIQTVVEELHRRRDRFEDSGVAVHGSMLQEVEVQQELEVESQVETIREIQQPRKQDVHAFTGLHPDLIQFVERGRLSSQSIALRPAFEILSRMFPKKKIDPSASAHEMLHPDDMSYGDVRKRLYLSVEFFRVTKRKDDNGSFVRDVRWVVWSVLSQIGVVVIDEEAEAIIPMIRGRKDSPTSLLLYSAPVSRDMIRSFNSVNFYSIPPLPTDWSAPAWFILELGLFSGRVYFEWHEYANLCEFLQLDPDQSVRDNDLLLSGLDGKFAALSLSKSTPSKDVANGNSKVVVPGTPPFSPQFILDFISLLRKGQDISQTPLNFVLHRQPLRQNFHFFDHADPIATRQARLKREQALLRSTDADDNGAYEQYGRGDEDDDEGEYYDDAHAGGPVDGHEEAADEKQDGIEEDEAQYYDINWGRELRLDTDGDEDGAGATGMARTTTASTDTTGQSMADWQQIGKEGL